MTDWMKSPISRRMVLAAPALALVACTPGANYAGPTEPGADGSARDMDVAAGLHGLAVLGGFVCGLPFQ